LEAIPAKVTCTVPSLPHKESPIFSIAVRPIVFFACAVSSFLAPAFAFDNSDLKAYSKLLPPTAQQEDPLRPTDQQSDNSVDPATYTIGGGDVFRISVVESPSIQYTGTVNENCDVYIPELGIIKIGRTTAVSAKKIIADFVVSKLRRQFEVYVSLIKTKTAVVTVSGAISGPGTYKLPGTSRLLDAIKAANNGVIPSYNEINFREVECRNRDSVRVYDLFRFLLANSLTDNPYLYPGDNIRISFAQRRVVVAGAIKSLVFGWVPIKQDEDAAGFFSLFPLDGAADSDHITIQRTNADNTNLTQVFSIRRPEPFTLRDRDLVIFGEKKNYPQVLYVIVRGEIERNGTFPLVKNVTTAADIIAMAGGATKNGNLDRAYVIRKNKMLSEEMKQSYNALKPVVTTGLFDNSVRPEVNAGLFRMNASNDFSVLRLSQNNNRILLESDDEIVVPKKEFCVYVSGSVSRPGAYPFEPGHSKAYYIGLAGGYSPKADKTNSFVVTNYGPVMQVRDGGALEEGDVVVVPDSQQYKFLAMVFLPIISTLAVTISTMLAIYTNIPHK